MPKEYTPKRPPMDPCPIETVISMVGGKWKARTLYLLAHGEYGFADLQRELGRVSQQVLSTQLRALQADGLITRAEPQTGDSHHGLYSASEKGRQLVRLLMPVADWGIGELGRRSAEWLDPVKRD